MNRDEFGDLIRMIGENWPEPPMTEGRQTEFLREIGEYPAIVVEHVLRAEFGERKGWDLTPIALGIAVRRFLMPSVPTWDEAYDEVMTAIARVGYMGTEPEWSHPAIGRWVERNGGWRYVCETTPARGGFDAQSVSAANTWRAQFRDAWKLLAERVDRGEEPGFDRGGLYRGDELPELEG